MINRSLLSWIKIIDVWPWHLIGVHQIKKAHIEALAELEQLNLEHRQALEELRNLQADVREGARRYLEIQHMQKIQQMGTTVNEYRRNKGQRESNIANDNSSGAQHHTTTPANDNIPKPKSGGVESISKVA